MQHRQRPEISVRARHMFMHQRADGIQVSIAMCNHHALGTRCRATGVVDRQQIVFLDQRPLKLARALRQQTFIIKPIGSRAGQRNKMLHRSQLGPNAVDSFEVIRMRADDSGTAVIY